jgi:putative acetyltransferase
MNIREAQPHETEDVLRIEREAFGGDEEANLVNALLNDPTAEPSLSLLAFEDEYPVGHILFTKARLDPESMLTVYLLAPLAVVPGVQGRGIGGALIDHGLRVLAESGVDIVFVLGHPGYYPRHGFVPAGEHGFSAPYPIPEKDAGAWMYQILNPDGIAQYRGTVRCAESLNKPEYWRE